MTKEEMKLKALLDKAFKFLVIQPRTDNPDHDRIYTELRDYVYKQR